MIVRNGSHLVGIMQGDESRKRLPPDGPECSDVEWHQILMHDVARPLEEVFLSDLDEFRLEKQVTHSDSDADGAMEDAQ